ncbi:Protein of uncharacterised function (DUF2788) [Pseudomonas aeruginosa]|nr:Protein of uncharacterised function (DUF2788) [Pseudomonas aeruginosa]
MDPELFEEWMMTGLVTVLILFMAFIVWDLAKKSKAGKFGTLILFFALGLGVLGFISRAWSSAASKARACNPGATRVIQPFVIIRRPRPTGPARLAIA